MASFESKPVTDGHPPEWVGPSNVNAYHRGHARDLRKGEVMEDGEMPLVADLIIMDAVLIDKITAGLREISCGYDCQYVPIGEGQYAQRQIRGNHIAVVKDGRAGDHVRIQDEKKKEVTKVAKKNILGHIFGLGWKQFTKDAEPEQVQEALEAVKESETPEKDAAPEFVKEKEEKKEEEKPAMDDNHAKLIGALKDCKSEDDMKKAFDDWMHKATDDPTEEKLDRIISLLERALSGGEEAGPEEAEDADLIPVETLPPEDRPKNPIPGADAEGHEAEETPAEEKKEEQAKDAAVKTFMRAIKPFIAQSRDKALIGAYNTIMSTGKSKASDGGYGKLLHLSKPEAVLDAENRRSQKRTVDQTAEDMAWGKEVTSQYLGKHPTQAAEDAKKRKEGK
jgi:hypothetical protein